MSKSDVNSIPHLNTLRWRCIGPPRGGRVVAVAGDSQNSQVFYFGAAAGGIWKTEDGGLFWENVSDGFLESSAVGALTVAQSDPNVIYAGWVNQPSELMFLLGMVSINPQMQAKHGKM